MKNVYYVGSGELTFDLIERIINENLKLELAPEAKLRIQKCRDYLDKKIAESEEPLYGITTGFGSLCSKSISSDELGTLQENLIKSHACSVGEEIRPVIIKLMMLLKAHALSLGHSGVQVITVQRILDFFNNDVMPIVYDRRDAARDAQQGRDPRCPAEGLSRLLRRPGSSGQPLPAAYRCGRCLL